MSSNNYIIDGTSFIIAIEQPLTDYNRKVLSYLYMPMIGSDAISLYNTLYTFIINGEQESKIMDHNQLIKMLRLKNIKTFLEQRYKLEAIGLLDVYFHKDRYVYVLKEVLNAKDFFQNQGLSSLLSFVVGDQEYTNLLFDFSVRRFDLSKYQKITQAFDNIFDVSYLEDEEKLNPQQLFIDTKNNGINIVNEHFDYQYFSIIVRALDIVDEEVIVNSEFYNLINRYSFFYKLTAEELKDALVCAVNINKQIDYEQLAAHVKRIYDNNHRSVKVIPKKVIISKDDKLSYYLETSSPNDVIKNKFGEELTSSEIAMFDQLLNDTGISLGVLNVLIIYITTDKNGEIPSYNYFLKVIKTWKRMGIKSVNEAIEYISNPKKKVTSNRGDNEKSVPDWYDDYIKSLDEKKINDQEEEFVNPDDFFNRKK